MKNEGKHFPTEEDMDNLEVVKIEVASDHDDLLSLLAKLCPEAAVVEVDKLAYEEQTIDVEILSRKEAEQKIKEGLPDYTAIISFYDPDKEPVAYPQNLEHGLVLHIPLDDFQQSLPSMDKVAQAVYTARAEGMSLICQCESGQSRSAGCTAAILEHFYRAGKLVFDNDRYRPDEGVYYAVLDALERKG